MLEFRSTCASYEQLLRVIAAAQECGADPDDGKVELALRMVKDRLADEVLQKAKKRQLSDQAMEEKYKGQPVPVGQATKLSDDIQKDIVAAKEKGVALTDKRMVEAKAIAAALRQADGVRKRMENREKKLKGKA